MIEPYYEDSHVKIYCGDCREILPELSPIESIITDPIWPNNSIPEFQKFNPYELLKESSALWKCQRAAIHFGCMSDPRMLNAIPDNLKFFRVCWLRYQFPSMRGRLLNGSDVAYLFGVPPASRKGNHLIPGEYNGPSTELGKNGIWHFS